jgi:hypothetical protein
MVDRKILSLFPSIHLRMLCMFLPVLTIEFCQFLVMNHEEIHSIMFLGCIREVERSP